MIQWSAFLLYFSPLLMVGYLVYRMIRDALIERVRNQHTDIGIQGYINARPYRFANDGTPIYGYQSYIEPNRVLPPPQSISATFTYEEAMAALPIGRYYPDTDTWEPAPYVKQEPLHDMPMECEMIDSML